MHITTIEFGRGRDKKKRKRRTEMGAAVRRGATAGAIVGTAATAAALSNKNNRQRFGTAVGQLYKRQRKKGQSRLGAGTYAGAATTGALANPIGQYAALGAGIAAGRTVVNRSVRNPIANARADRKANKEYQARKRKKRK